MTFRAGFYIRATSRSPFTDRAEAHIPIGHQRVYARLDPPFSYAQWIEAIRKGATFVTNAPMVEPTVDGAGPGGEIMLDAPRALRVRAVAESQLPFTTLDVVVNGEVVRSEPAAGGRRARVEFDLPVRGPVWIAARALGARHPEIMYYPHPGWSHPVVGHTSPVYVTVPGTPARSARAAASLIDDIEESVRFIRKRYRFASEADRALSLGRFEEGRQKLARIVAGA